MILTRLRGSFCAIRSPDDPKGSITLGLGHEGSTLKTSRAYIAGLGTTGVLIGSFFLLLTVGSTLVAFRGVPGAASNGDLSSIELRQQREAGRARAAPACSPRATCSAMPREGSPRARRDRRRVRRSWRARAGQPGRPASGRAPARNPGPARPRPGARAHRWASRLRPARQTTRTGSGTGVDRDAGRPGVLADDRLRQRVGLRRQRARQRLRVGQRELRHGLRHGQRHRLGHRLRHRPRSRLDGSGDSGGGTDSGSGTGTGSGRHRRRPVEDTTGAAGSAGRHGQPGRGARRSRTPAPRSAACSTTPPRSSRASPAGSPASLALRRPPG